METKYCPRCESDLPLDAFYERRNRSGLHTCYCRACLKAQYSERHFAFKQKCVDYKGGKCQVCGYNRCLGAMDFHHLDPSQKDFALASRKNRGDWDTVQKELDKCILVCCRCHREIHEGVITPPAGLEPATHEFRVRCSATELREEVSALWDSNPPLQHTRGCRSPD